MNLRVLTRAVQLLSDVDFWNMQDYCPEDSEFLDGEIVIVEARDTNSRYKRVTLVYPDESDDPRVSRLAEWARKWARA